MSKKWFKGHFRHVFRGEVEGSRMDFIKAAFKTVIQRYVDEQVNIEDMDVKQLKWRERKSIRSTFLPMS